MEETDTDKSEKTHHPDESSKEEAHDSLQEKGIVNGLQKMSGDSKGDLVIVPKSIIDEYKKKDGRFLIIVSTRKSYDPYYLYMYIYIPNVLIK